MVLPAVMSSNVKMKNSSDYQISLQNAALTAIVLDIQKYKKVNKRMNSTEAYSYKLDIRSVNFKC